MIKLQEPKGMEMRYNMKTERQQELDLEAPKDDFSIDTTSSAEEEPSMGDNSEDLVEIMGTTLGNIIRRDCKTILTHSTASLWWKKASSNKCCSPIYLWVRGKNICVC